MRSRLCFLDEGVGNAVEAEDRGVRLEVVEFGAASTM
jgi:hypothetical protein